MYGIGIYNLLDVTKLFSNGTIRKATDVNSIWCHCNVNALMTFFSIILIFSQYIHVFCRKMGINHQPTMNVKISYFAVFLVAREDVACHTRVCGVPIFVSYVSNVKLAIR